MQINEITSAIINESIYIHKKIGPGLFESVYEEVLCYRLKEKGFMVKQQAAIPVVFDEVIMNVGFRADLIVDSKVLIEIKSLEIVPLVASKQVLTYLRFADIRVGLIINFGTVILKDGIKRIV